jgi:hypothetical protein
MHASKALWILLIIAAIGGAFVGGYSIDKQTAPVTVAAPGNAGFDAGYEAAKKKIEDSGIVPPTSAQVLAVSGSVTAVSGNSVTINANPVSINPLEDQGPSIRVITVTSTTEINIKVALTNAEFQTALGQFTKDSAAGKQVAPPDPFRTVKGSLSDIKVGMIITATAETDVRDAESITATNIDAVKQ